MVRSWRVADFEGAKPSREGAVDLAVCGTDGDLAYVATAFTELTSMIASQSDYRHEAAAIVSHVVCHACVRMPPCGRQACIVQQSRRDDYTGCARLVVGMQHGSMQ